MQQSPHHTTETSIFARPLGTVTLFCCRNPVLVLMIAVLLAALSLYGTSERLEFQMSRLDLINPNSNFNKLWLNYIDEFGDHNEVIAVVEGHENSEVIAVLKRLAKEIAEFPELYQDVLHGIDLSGIHRKGLHYVPAKDLQMIQQFVEQALTLLDPRNQQPSPPMAMGDVTNLLTTLAQSRSAEGEMKYFLFPTDEGVAGILLLRLVNMDKTQFSQGTEAIGTLRKIVKQVRAEHPALQIGLTGMPILEYDEMALSNDAMAKATLLSFVGVCIVFMAGFGSLRHPFLAMLALLTAFAWTMGYITFAVGHLNIMSVAFGAMLIGLGTDFSVHYLGKYLELRQRGLDCLEALCQAAELVGPGILTGMITTSAAFYAASFTEFTGVAELGIIVGGGILFCGTATFTVLPALVTLTTSTAPGKNVLSDNLFDIRGVLRPVLKFPKMTLFLFALGFLYLLTGLPNVWYDHNLLNLQPEGIESVQLEHRLLSMNSDEGGKNAWFALTIADTKEELLERKKLFVEKYPELKTEEIISYFPEAEPERIRIIQSLAGMLQTLPDQLPAMVHPQIAEVIRRLQTLKAMAVPEPPTIDDLPESLVSRFVGKHGKHLMRVYATANIWDMDEMKKFVEAVRDIDPDATGSPLQTYESSLQMQTGFLSALYYVLVAILLVTWVDFRSITASFVALLPTFLGFTMMFGIIGLLDLPLNPANMIALPIVMSIGIDDGIHLIHEFRRHRSERYMPSSATMTGILITTLTTLVGFGSMMTASHRGLQSLGRVFVIGAVCCMFTSIIVLPAILSLWTRGKEKGSSHSLMGNSATQRKRLIRRGV